jgi:hypothetical protein
MHIGGPLHCYTWGGCPDYGNLGSAWLQWNEGMMTMLRLQTTIDCFPDSMFDVWKVFEHLHMLWIGMWVHPFTGYTWQSLAQILVIWGQCGYEMMAWWHCWGCRPLLTASQIHIGIWKVFEHLHMLWIGILVHPYTVTLAKLVQNWLFGVSMVMKWWPNEH